MHQLDIKVLNIIDARCNHEGKRHLEELQKTLVHHSVFNRHIKENKKKKKHSGIQKLYENFLRQLIFNANRRQ